MRPEVPRAEHRVGGRESGGSDTASGAWCFRLFPRPRTVGGWILAPLTWLAIALIRFYQVFLSPGLPPSCRFAPSCSQYTLEAVQRYGALKGVWLGGRRLVRCHPWHPGGYDPVP